MKKTLLLLFMFMSLASTVFAQVPTIMMYQVQVNHGESGPKDVRIEMQLRKSQDGAAIWNQFFDFTEMKNYTTVNLALDLGDKFDWNDGEYWLATIIDGKEMGCAQLTSVPYAYSAKTAETLSSNITREELIGHWIDAERPNNEYEYHYYFYKDGTLEYHKYGKLYYTGTWKLSGTILKTRLVDADNGKVEDEDRASALFYDKEEKTLYQARLTDYALSLYTAGKLKKVK